MALRRSTFHARTSSCTPPAGTDQSKPSQASTFFARWLPAVRQELSGVCFCGAVGSCTVLPRGVAACDEGPRDHEAKVMRFAERTSKNICSENFPVDVTGSSPGMKLRAPDATRLLHHRYAAIDDPRHPTGAFIGYRQLLEDLGEDPDGTSGGCLNLGPETSHRLRPRAGQSRNSEKFKAITDGVPDSASSLGQAPPGPMMSRPRLFGKPTGSSNVSQGDRGIMGCQFVHEIGPRSKHPCAPVIHQVQQVMGLVKHSARIFSATAGARVPQFGNSSRMFLILCENQGRM